MDVAIVMGSDSDWDIVKKAVDTLKDFGVDFAVTVASAHRTPQKVRQFVESCNDNGVKIFIAAAGCAAHLAGVVASYTTRPVIGIPVASEPLKGCDSLLSTVQMPSGIPVATVAVNGAKNAAILALEIMAVSDGNIERKLIEYRRNMVDEIERKDAKIKTYL